MFTKIVFRFLAAAFVVCPAAAQEIKVDFNFNNKPLSQTADAAYTPWSTNSIWFSGGDTISNTFSGVTFTFKRVGTIGTGLTTDWYSAGIATAKLVNDGITVTPFNQTNIVGTTTAPGARIELTISNLTAGAHTLLTWHNTWQNPSAYTFSPLNIYLNGAQIITNLPVSNRVTNNADGSYSYVKFTADGVNNTVVTFEASTNFNANVCNVSIDGFEIDTPDFKYKANKPSPVSGDEHVDADATKNVLLYWTKAALAVSNRVYFGTSSNAVLNATTGSAEFKGTQVSTNLLVTNLSTLATYWWRIDEVDATNGVTKGDLWYFRTRHLAFPGAEGYGRFARGGRGGVVIEVTNTNDSGAGSLRDALTGNYGPRTVVFAVSGLITLESDLIISQNTPYLTLAGQTAPGKGICTRKYQLGMSGGRDAIVRNVRSRPGNLSGTTLNGSGMSGSDHCIFDHVSISWGIDEELSTRTAKNITFQRCLISEALNIAGHQNYPPGTAHGYAASVGGNIASLHHNLLAHNEGRNWSLAGGLDANGNFDGSLDIFNNVVHNWGGRTTDGGAHQVNFVGNYYKKGAASSIFVALKAQYDNFPGTQQYYFTNNVMPGTFDYSNQTAGRTAVNGTGTVPTNYSPWVNVPFFPSYATVEGATNAYKSVLSDVGCTQPQIDDHDVRVIRETLDGTYTFTGTGPYGGSPGLPNSQDDVGGWENYPFVQRAANFDTDHDGLPDWWETIKGLNTNSAPGDFSDSNADLVDDEYTELERYLNWLAAPHFDCTVGTSLDVNLTAFTRGYTNTSPTYTVSAPTNGSVTLIGGNTARFTPSVSSNALGSFTFIVTDLQGASLTNTVGIHIAPAAAAPAQPPTLGLRNQSGALMIELTGENGRSLTVQSKTDLLGTWLDWTNVSGSGALQLLPLNSLTNQSPRYFRAFAQ
ncbi:MAG: T9SS C-terminal target domain-containing protein [Verrucomicrobia bacterium]|nr:MAG: T9SS C-terminal target domain-containing protein [Verrucomicrobiota bacterium]